MITSDTIIPEIFNFIKMKAYTFLPQDRYVILAFEEFAYHKELFMSMKNSTIKCPPFFVVFAIQNIKKQLYQPIVCVFWDRTKLSAMANLIRVIIHALYLAGLTVVATVCKHHFIMCSVIKHLVQIPNDSPSQAFIYSVGPEVQNIIHIFDAKALLKDVHHKFSRIPFQFSINESTYFTNPDVLRLVYLKKASSDASTKVFLGDRFGLLENINKVFCSLGDRIKDAVEKGELKKSAIGTSLFCTVFNGLCDSFTSWDENAHGLFQRPVPRQNANHFAFWAYATNILKSMYLRRSDKDVESTNTTMSNSNETCNKFEDEEKKTQVKSTLRKPNFKLAVNNSDQSLVQPCCINLWLCNISGITKIVQRLHEKRFKAVPTKNFSIDPVVKFVRKTLPSKRFDDVCDDEPYEMKEIDEEMAKRIFRCNNILTLD